jgi:hypothetical protein
LRMHWLDCGRLIAKDRSRWTPGVGIEHSREFASNCYLLQHTRGTPPWDSGVPDAAVGKESGVTSPKGVVVCYRNQTLRRGFPVIDDSCPAARV